MMQFRLLIFMVLLAGALGGLVHRSAVAATVPPYQTRIWRVATKPIEPLVIKKNGHWTGFSIELWEVIAEELQLDYEWIEVTSVTEQLEAVRKGQADVAIAGISMTPEREQLIDFTHPYFDAGLQILTSVGPEGSVTSLMSTFFSPPLLQILGIALLGLLVIAHIIWLIEPINGTLLKLKQDGTYASIYAKWFGNAE